LEPDPGNSGVGKRTVVNTTTSPPFRAVFFVSGGNTMHVSINGEKREVATGSTVRQLLDELQISATRVAVEVNLEIVPKTAYAGHTLHDDDKIEIVHFVGGG
jgi:thiamine biosynthesis protein ThiS